MGTEARKSGGAARPKLARERLDVLLVARDVRTIRYVLERLIWHNTTRDILRIE